MSTSTLERRQVAWLRSNLVSRASDGQDVDAADLAHLPTTLRADAKQIEQHAAIATEAREAETERRRLNAERAEVRRMADMVESEMLDAERRERRARAETVARERLGLK